MSTDWTKPCDRRPQRAATLNGGVRLPRVPHSGAASKRVLTRVFLGCVSPAKLAVFETTSPHLEREEGIKRRLRNSTHFAGISSCAPLTSLVWHSGGPKSFGSFFFFLVHFFSPTLLCCGTRTEPAAPKIVRFKTEKYHEEAEGEFDLFEFEFLKRKMHVARKLLYYIVIVLLKQYFIVFIIHFISSLLKNILL